MLELANKPHGPENDVSEQSKLMDENSGKKDQPEEPKKTTPSTANGSHDNAARNGGSNPNQVALARCCHDSCCHDSCFNIHTRYLIIIAFLSLALIGILAWCLSPRATCPSCPESWLLYKGKCYYFSDTEGNWTSSQNNCTLFGASLAPLDTPEEMAFVRRYKDRTDYWIGLRREAVGEPWKWPNGSVFNDSFKIGADGLCAYLNDEDASSTWCHTKRNWICRRFLHAP